MNSICKTCNQEFEVRGADLVFYEQMKTVPPLYCPDCRMARRLVFRNERTLYKRPCDLCKKDMITVYSPESPFTVYCHDCWWSDNWNPKGFAIDYDLNKKLGLTKNHEIQEKLKVQAKRMKDEFAEEFNVIMPKAQDLNIIGKELVIQEEMGL